MLNRTNVTRVNTVYGPLLTPPGSFGGIACEVSIYVPLTPRVARSSYTFGDVARCQSSRHIDSH